LISSARSMFVNSRPGQKKLIVAADAFRIFLNDRVPVKSLRHKVGWEMDCVVIQVRGLGQRN